MIPILSLCWQGSSLQHTIKNIYGIPNNFRFLTLILGKINDWPMESLNCFYKYYIKIAEQQGGSEFYGGDVVLL